MKITLVSKRLVNTKPEAQEHVQVCTDLSELLAEQFLQACFASFGGSFQQSGRTVATATGVSTNHLQPLSYTMLSECTKLVVSFTLQTVLELYESLSEHRPRDRNMPLQVASPTVIACGVSLLQQRHQYWLRTALRILLWTLTA